MKQKIELLWYAYSNYGFIKGLILLIGIKLKFVNKLKVPGIRYPITLRKNTSDIPVFYQLFIKNEYEMNIDNVKNAKIIIDGGANIGLFAVLMKNRCPDSTIICIEPDPENFKLLQKNIRPYTNIYCENCGLWHRDTYLKVHDKYNYGKWGIIVEEVNDGNIRAISMNTLLQKYLITEVDILKLDIEGSEKYLFSENYTDWLSKVKKVIIELHDWIAEDSSKMFFEAINQTFQKYYFDRKGENVTIINKSNKSN